MKEAESDLSRLIAVNANPPKVSFNPIDSVLNPSRALGPDPSPEPCDEFLNFSVKKIDRFFYYAFQI